MSKVINHGKIDFNCEDILKLLPKAERSVFPDYNDSEYWKNRQQDYAFRRKMADIYNKSAHNYHYHYDWLSVLPTSFFSVTKLKKEPINIDVFQMMPAKFTPPHKDEYGGFVANNPNETAYPTRIWIPLTKPSIGHALFFEDEVVYNVKEGTILEFPKDALHSACNAGHESRIIMAITGVKENGK